MFRRYRFIDGLTSLHLGNKEFFTNYLGEVRNKMGHLVETRKDSEGHLIVNVHGWDGQRDYRVIDLMVFQYKCPKIPVKDYHKVNAFVIDGDKTNVQAKNIGYRFEGGKLEVDGYPGFYYIPTYSNYAINIDGLVIKISTGKTINCNITKQQEKKNITGGYYVYSLTGDIFKQFTIGRHRALCLVFKDYPDEVDSMVVNHLNGIPGDDSLDNLEWCTRGQNNTHAYVNDLKNQHMRVLARNVLTGEVTEYYSICECARQHGCPTDETIRFRLYKCKFSQVFSNGYQYKFKNDDRDWVIPEDPKKALEEGQFKKSVISKNCLTSETILHESVTAAGKMTGILHGSIEYRLKRDNRSPLFGYQFKLANDQRDFPSFTQEEYQKSLLPSTLEVDARNLITGEIKSFPSVIEAYRQFGGSIAEPLRNGLQPISSTGWQFKFKDDVFREVDNVEETLYPLRRDIMAKSEDGKVVHIFDSTNQLTDFLKELHPNTSFDPKAIRKAALTRGRKLYKGYYFKLGLDDPWPI